MTILKFNRVRVRNTLVALFIGVNVFAIGYFAASAFTPLIMQEFQELMGIVEIIINKL